MSDDDLIAVLTAEASAQPPRITPEDLAGMLRKVRRSPEAVADLARHTGHSAAAVRQMCGGDIEPSDRVLAAFGLRREVRFVPARFAA